MLLRGRIAVGVVAVAASVVFAIAGPPAAAQGTDPDGLNVATVAAVGERSSNDQRIEDVLGSSFVALSESAGAGELSVLTLDLRGLSESQQRQVLESAVSDLQPYEISRAGSLKESASIIEAGATLGRASSTLGATATDTAPVAALSTSGILTRIRCNQDASFTDANNWLNIRNNCTYSNVNWANALSTAVRSIINSPVSERGARGYRNYVFVTQNAAHAGVSKFYTFHGTFPISGSCVLQYTNFFSFTVYLAGRTVPGSVTVSKIVTLSP